jgi:hypothetical protein
VDQNQHFKQLHISTLSPPASSVLQAEAFALHLAMLAEAIQLQAPYFFTDSYVLAKAAAAVSIKANQVSKLPGSIISTGVQITKRTTRLD